MRLQNIRELNDEGHVGQDQMLQLVTSFYFWPSLRRDVVRFVECCRAYQQAKDVTSNAGLYFLLPVPTQPWTDISINFMLGLLHTQRGHDYIFVVVDRFSQMAYFIPYKRLQTCSCRIFIFSGGLSVIRVTLVNSLRS